MHFSPAAAALLVRRNGGTDEEAIFLASVVPGESGGDPDIVNTHATCGPNGERAVGLFQICSFAHRGTVEQLKDPDRNALVALGILRDQGEGAWTADPDPDAAEEARRALAGQEEPMGVVEQILKATALPIMDGCPIVWEDGWESRGTRDAPDEDFDPHGVVCHHTAGARSGDYPSLGIVRDGRPDLAGPLSQFGLGRETLRVIAAGRSNHAGPGGWRGLVGNGSVWGIEAENPGTPTSARSLDAMDFPWTPFQVKWYPRLCAALCAVGGFGAEMVCMHREWNPIDKPDPCGIDATEFRAQVQAVLAGADEGDDELQSDEREKLFEAAANSAATNAAVGRLEIAVRDQTSGLQAQMAELIAAVKGGSK